MNKTRRLTYLSMLLAIAFILSWAEHLMPPLVPAIPAIKIGLANIIILFGIFNLKKREALMILASRLLLNALLFGNMLSLAYSAAGGILSFAVMAAAEKISGNAVTSSIAGGISHNLGQLLIAYILLDSAAVFSYFPYLTIAGIIAGAFNGIAVSKLNSAFQKIGFKE